jgi:hypothetical protein
VNVDVAVESKSHSHVSAFVGTAPALETRAVIVAAAPTVAVTGSMATVNGAGAGAVTFTSTVAEAVTLPFDTVTFAIKMPDVGYGHDVVIADVESVDGALESQSHVQEFGGGAPLTRVTLAVSVVLLPAAMVAGDAETVTV